MWRELFLVAYLLPVITANQCYHEKNGKLFIILSPVCVYEYDEQLSKHVRRTAREHDEEIRLRPGESRICWPIDAHCTACQCNTELCNNLIYCHVGDKLDLCPNSCSTRFEPYTDRPGYNITRECGSVPWMVAMQDAKCTAFSNGSATCECDTDQCNNQTFGMQCYEHSPGRLPLLVDCPYFTTSCYSVRDPTSRKIIEGGCVLSNNTSNYSITCNTTKCNYPMYCHNYFNHSLIHCSEGVETCTIGYEKINLLDVGVSSGGCGEKSVGKLIDESCQINETSKQCVCAGDMCNYWNNGKLHCYYSHFSEGEYVVPCLMGTAHCFTIGYLHALDPSMRGMRSGCLVFESKIGCQRDQIYKICSCEGNYCNKELLDLSCYVYNGTDTPKLEVCPYKAFECYVARDPSTKMFIEGGCDITDHGNHELDKCSTDGCNYPMYCYDSIKDKVTGCGINVSSCYIHFEKIGKFGSRFVTGCNHDNVSESISSESFCEKNEMNTKNCLCFGDMCNYETSYKSIHCYVSNGTEPAELIKCPFGTTHCYSVLLTDQTIKTGCSIFDEDDGCRSENKTKICVCRGEACNKEMPRIKCFVSNETTPATLETCALRTTECFVARDPKAQKLIEAGCDVSDHGSQLVEKCSSDGCNYPMFCYDSSKDAIVQCEIGDVGCYVEFEKQDPHGTKQVSGCSPTINSNVSNLSEAVCSLNGGRKQCICSGDMCNHETHFESINCQVSSGSGSMESIKCPLGTTECYIVDEKDGTNNMGCSIFEGGNEGCSMEDGVKTCFCHDDTCNQNVSQIHCYIADKITPAVLKTCPFEAVGCYVARDDQTWKLVEAGCD
uniref:Uncharacterized protein n=1 Tax=Panagrolaimus sp. JU765 TaxID=591449 RepID=A0AC34Q7E3_9BILA